MTEKDSGERKLPVGRKIYNTFYYGAQEEKEATATIYTGSFLFENQDIQKTKSF